MKKNVLALSIATAVVGFAGSAHAIGTIGGTATANDLQFGNTGTGHMLLVPYFSTQDGNANLLSLINTDTVNGKAVKVRFRGARNSDDVFDFQVFLSPGDVWTANISKNKDGLSYLKTEDNTCTKPSKAKINDTPFITSRLNPNVTAEEKANNTREGYVEIFNMADIPKSTTGLYPLIKHANSVAKCADDGTNLAWSAINKDLANEAAYKNPAIGMTNPTTGLAANWTIMNVPKALSWSGAATAIEAVNSAVNPSALASGNIVYFPQVSEPVTNPGTFSSDPLFVGSAASPTTPAYAAAMYDLPDMSTPYTVYTAESTNWPADQAIKLADAITTRAVINEFWTEPTIKAETDWVFSMPTRRYAVAVDYSATKPTAVYNTTVNKHFTSANTVMNGDAVCVRNVTYTVWDREENSPASPDDVVISPGTPTAPTLFCGETSVLSFNNAGAAQSAVLAASVSLKDMDTGYANGWAQLNTPGARVAGLPILGQAFVSAYNPSVASGTAGNFGVNWGHRFVRVTP
ncbi:cell surface protein [Diaphorobacter aerolatus]|uniref:Cell surface protein n=1 Tax=Diaphorobacter aerolatus TaxID=1288495 RepID=A0A7H0GNU2_9BURK|nr:cell surface protein [Diaphorobacter aerolatus]QNP49958.1 cell surface protein [Diaphorobacter aerolatus]